MSGFQPITKQDIREINTGLSLFCTEEKSKSASPARKIFRAKRRGNNNNINNNNNHNQMFINNNFNKNDQFENMKESQYIEYQKNTMEKRMKRKRKFDVFSSGSNVSLNEILSNSKTYRVPHYAMFYVRVDQKKCNDNISDSNDSNKNNQRNNNNNNNNNNNIHNISNSAKNAFDLMFMGSKAMRNENNIYNENKDEMVFEKEECLITRCIRISSQWVIAYNSYDIANNIAWSKFNVNGRIHEYQIDRSHGIILLNLGESKQYKVNIKHFEQDIKQWVLDHGYSGYIMDECFYLYQPHLYWNLLDDHKKPKVKQTLISDMFQSTKSTQSKPKHSPWNFTY